MEAIRDSLLGVIGREALQELETTFAGLTPINVAFLDADGNYLTAKDSKAGSGPAFCRLVRSVPRGSQRCHRTHLAAGRQHCAGEEPLLAPAMGACFWWWRPYFGKGNSWGSLCVARY